MTVDYGATRVLDDVSLSIEHGQIHALMGANGSGKSTLIKVLGGLVSCNAGASLVEDGRRTPFNLTPRRSQRLGLRFVHQDRGIIPSQSVLENFYLGNPYPLHFRTSIARRAARQRAGEGLAVAGLRVKVSQRAGELSDSQQIALVMARALAGLSAAGGFLVLDEPTAGMTEEDSAQLIKTLHELVTGPFGILIVSHRLEEVESLGGPITVLRNGRMALNVPSGAGSPDAVLDAITGDDEMLVRQVTTPVRCTEPGPVVANESLTLIADGLSGASFTDVSFKASSGEVFGITGLEGCGKDEFAQVLAGVLPRRAGTVSLGGTPLRLSTPRDAIRHGIALVPADRRAQGGILDLPVADNMLLPRLDEFHRFVFDRAAEKAEAAALVTRYFIEPRDFTTAFWKLSGGNQQKVVFAKWASAAMQALIFHNPTVGVDIPSRERLYELIRSRRESDQITIVVSSDFREMLALCDRVGVFTEGLLIETLAATDLTLQRLIRSSYGYTRDVSEGH